MNALRLNETPVRTSRNFLINNIKLEDVKFPSGLSKFNSVVCNTVHCVPSIDYSNYDTKLVYGIGDVAEQNVANECNSVIRFDVNEKDDIKVSYDFDDDNLSLVNFIEVDARADCNVCIEYNSRTEKKCFHNGILKLNASNGSKVNVVIVNLLNNSSINLEAIENSIDENSNVNYTIIDIGAKTSVSNYYSNLHGRSGKNDLKTIYLGTDNQIKDINYIAELFGEKTDINIDVQGALRNGSKKNFKGTIDFKKGCKKAVGNENEYCMLLSDDSKSIALPMLLCSEDDVEGNHSTASGKVDSSELFYIMTRGVPYSDAIKLIVKARFNEIINGITDEELKNKVLDEIDRRLD